MHHADAVPDGVARPLHRHRRALDQNLAPVGADQAIQNVHQGALAGAVLADQGVDLALADLEVDVVVGDHAGKDLGDAPEFDGQRRLVGVRHSAPGIYGMPSAAGGLLRRTTAASTIRVSKYGVMLSKYCDTWMLEFAS